MTEETFMEQVSPIPEHDYFYFSKPDPSLGGNNYSRACINFVNVDDIYLFRDKFDGYVFLDEKGKHHFLTSILFITYFYLKHFYSCIN